MSFLKRFTPETAKYPESNSSNFQSCKGSYSAQHPLLAARLTTRSIHKRDHLDDYKDVNPFVRAEAGEDDKADITW